MIAGEIIDAKLKKYRENFYSYLNKPIPRWHDLQLQSSIVFSVQVFHRHFANDHIRGKLFDVVDAQPKPIRTDELGSVVVHILE